MILNWKNYGYKAVNGEQCYENAVNIESGVDIAAHNLTHFVRNSSAYTYLCEIW